jgi:hypothetical protein
MKDARFKEKEENIEIETWSLIRQAEKGLRELVLSVLKKKFGGNWEHNYPKKYESIPAKKKRLHDIFDMLINAQKRDFNQYGNLSLNLTLLDQTYIHQLFDYFILFSWEDLFKSIFKKEKKYWNKVKLAFENVRNPIAHHKTELLLESEIKEVEEYCRDIIATVENYLAK